MNNDRDFMRRICVVSDPGVGGRLHNISEMISSERVHVLKVLLAEDDLMIADQVEYVLLANGYEVCGIARTVAEAVALGRLHRPDLAVIDMRLADGGFGTDIIPQLPAGPRIGVLYASGNVNEVFELAGSDACIAKPFRSSDLVRALKIVQQIVTGGAASPPFPKGFHLLTWDSSPPRKAPYV